MSAHAPVHASMSAHAPHESMSSHATFSGGGPASEQRHIVPGAGFGAGSGALGSTSAIVASFFAADAEERASITSQLCSAWAAASSIPARQLHEMTLQALLDESRESAARLGFIDSVMARTLIELMRADRSSRATSCTSRWLEMHPTGTGLAQAVSQELRSAQRGNEGDVLDALRLLAPLSAVAREKLLPSVLATRITDFTSGESVPSAGDQVAIMRDTGVLGGLCSHRYDALCERGFPCREA